MSNSYELEVGEIINLSPTAKALRYFLKESVPFQPGQFFIVEFLLKRENGFYIRDNKLEIQKRAFSISSSPTSPYLEITVKKTSSPFVSDYLVSYLKKGERAVFTGPYGHFIFNPEQTNKSMLLLAAGSGIAPLMSILRYVNEKKLRVKIHLIYSNKTEREILWREEIEDIAKKNKNMTYTFTLTQDNINLTWQEERGRINKNMIHKIISDWEKENIDCYICGPLEFTREMEKALEENGIPNNSIKHEIYE